MMKDLQRIIETFPGEITRTQWHDYLFYYFELPMESDDVAKWDAFGRSHFLYQYKMITQLFGALSDIKLEYNTNGDLLSSLKCNNGENLEILQMFTAEWGDGSELLKDITYYFGLIVRQNMNPFYREELKYYEKIIYQIVTNQIIQIIKSIYELKDLLREL